MFLLALAACTSAPAPTPAPEPAPAEEPAPQAPEVTAAPITVEPLGIRWNEANHTIQIEARLAGTGLASRDQVVHVGVTVITTSDKEIDLLVHSLFPAALQESLLFSTELPEAPKHVLIGAWDQKVEPCAVDRPGCREFGFVLDGSLGSFPAGLYTKGARQRLLPDTIAIATSQASPDHVDRAQDYATVFGTQVTATVVETTRAPGVWVQRSDDLPWAEAVGRDLPTHVDPQLEQALLVVLPK